MRTGVSKGGVFDARERGTQRPFGLILLVLFLQKQEKYIFILTRTYKNILPHPCTLRNCEPPDALHPGVVR